MRGVVCMQMCTFFSAIISYCFDYEVNAVVSIVSCEGDIGDRVAVMDRCCYSSKQNTLRHTDSIQTVSKLCRV